MKTRHKRLAIAAGVVLVIAAAAALILNAFQSNLVFFFSPTQIESKEAPVNRTFRLGGLVVAGSVKRTGVAVDFLVTDTAKTVPVHFEGILPDLFKEGKGVVAQGKRHAQGQPEGKMTKFRNHAYLPVTRDAAVFSLLLAAFFRASAASGGM